MNAPAVRVDEPLDDFIARHRAALAENEARHIVMLGLLDIAEADRTKTLRTWSLGEGGACAVLGPGRLLLGDLDEPQCAALAEAMTNETYRALVGPDETAKWFVARAEALGRRFHYVMPQRIMALTGPPRTPDAPGAARSVTAEDIERLADWLDAFVAEAVPNDPPIPDERKAAIAASGDAFFWEVEGRPVSTAAIVRETGNRRHLARLHPACRARPRLCRRGHRRRGRGRLRARQACGLALHRPPQPGLQPLLREDRVHAGLRLPRLQAGRG